MAVLVDRMQIEWPLLLLNMTVQKFDDIVSCHHVTMHTLFAMAAIEAANALGLGNNLLGLGTVLACVVLMHTNNQVA